MKLTLPKKLFFSLIILIVIILGILATILYPTIKTIITLGTDIGNIQQDLEERYEISQKLRRSLQEINEVEKNTKQFSEVYIQKGDELKVITDLENIALEHKIEQDMNITFVENQAANKTAMPQYYKISFVNNGYFLDQIAYLESLKKLPYYLIIQNINLEKRNKKEGEISPIVLTFEARVYVENK